MASGQGSHCTEPVGYRPERLWFVSHNTYYVQTLDLNLTYVVKEVQEEIEVRATGQPGLGIHMLEKTADDSLYIIVYNTE